jgi:hypothetical protein
MVRACCAFAFVVASVALAQTEFSADIVNTQKQDAVQAKAYFGKDKMRFESQEKTSRGAGGAFIMDLAAHTSLVLMPEQHMYMEMPAQTTDQRGMYYFFRSGDVENACTEWLKMPHNTGGTCRKVGSETVNGRNTIKYEGTNTSGEASAVWLDPKLRFPVKWQGKNSGGELRNIREGSQPASLFEVPSGYSKMDIGAMMQQKQH